MKKVLAIILNWNGIDFSRDCCASLAAQTHRDLDVLVVDNGSTENTVDALREVCPRAKVIGTGVNLGFAGGVNAGLKSISNLGSYGYVWLLNNDVLCDPDALERLLAKAESDLRLCAVGCAMREGSEEGGVSIVQAGKRLRPPFYVPTAVASVEEVDYLCGASLLIAKKALDEVGLLDENFFFFFEDADWSFRAKMKGWKLGIADGVFLRHVGGGTIRKNSYNRARYYRSGHVRFLRRHARHPLLSSALIAFYRLLCDLCRFNLSAARGTVVGFVKGWQNRVAKMG